MRKLEVRDLGRLPYAEALALQRSLAADRKQGLIPDQLLLVEHPHVLTMGRNAHAENVLVPRTRLSQLGIEYFEIDRGGDVTYHGPGQIVGYPIVDLREWKRDVVAYVRALEAAIIATLARFNVPAFRDPTATGVWTPAGKICAIGVHISRWVTTHGFALNWTTDLSFYQHIVPCGLPRPVASLGSLGVEVAREPLLRAIVEEFALVFDYQPALVAASA